MSSRFPKPSFLRRGFTACNGSPVRSRPSAAGGNRNSDRFVLRHAAVSLKNRALFHDQCRRFQSQKTFPLRWNSMR